MNKISFKLAIITMSVVVSVSGVCNETSPALARQSAGLTSNGDPGDGSEADPSGGGYGDPTDGEDGDQTDFKGWMAYERGAKGGDFQIVGTGDPGDGEEVRRTDGAGSHYWQEWLEFIRQLLGG